MGRTTVIKQCCRRIARRLASEHGFTMLTASMASFAAMTLSASALTYVNNDVQIERRDRFTALALQAVQTGAADYTQQLAVNTDYFSLCDQGPGSHAVNDTDIGLTAQQGSNSPVNATNKILRRWMPASGGSMVTAPTGGTGDPAVAGSYDSEYSIDLLPANGKLSCKQMSDRVATMVDATQATFRVRITGRAGPRIPDAGTSPTIMYDKAGNTGTNDAQNREKYKQNFWSKRSVVIDYRRRGFLDFTWLTDQENFDPPLESNPTYAEANCTIYYRDGRKDKTCTEIHFVSGDWIKGPLHTNDELIAENGAQFGRAGGNDRIEISATSCRIRSGDRSGCYNPLPTYNGPVIWGANAPVLPLPEANEDLATYGENANGGHTYTGWTTVELKNNGTYDVTNANENGGNLQTLAYPSNGVIYVKNGAGCDGYNYTTGWNPAGDATCGLLAIKGTYNKSLTFAAEDDIVITGNINRDADPSSDQAVLGLIANKYVRVRHYATGNSGSCTNQAGTVTNITAGILALQHSFMLDWWRCGNSLGTLTVNGAIAQKYRGPIGTGGGTGYLKNYNYDDRLRYRTPPYFLSPAYAGWRTVRFREQAPACACNENATLLP